MAQDREKGERRKVTRQAILREKVARFPRRGGGAGVWGGFLDPGPDSLAVPLKRPLKGLGVF